MPQPSGSWLAPFHVVCRRCFRLLHGAFEYVKVRTFFRQHRLFHHSLAVAVHRLLQKRLDLLRIGAAQKRQNDCAAVGMERNEVHPGLFRKRRTKNAAELERLGAHGLFLYKENAALPGDMRRRNAVDDGAEPHGQQQCRQQHRSSSDDDCQRPEHPVGKYR